MVIELVHYTCLFGVTQADAGEVIVTVGWTLFHDALMSLTTVFAVNSWCLVHGVVRYSCFGSGTICSSRLCRRWTSTSVWPVVLVMAFVCCMGWFCSSCYVKTFLQGVFGSCSSCFLVVLSVSPHTIRSRMSQSWRLPNSHEPAMVCRTVV